MKVYVAAVVFFSLQCALISSDMPSDDYIFQERLVKKQGALSLSRDDAVEILRGFFAKKEALSDTELAQLMGIMFSDTLSPVFDDDCFDGCNPLDLIKKARSASSLYALYCKALCTLIRQYVIVMPSTESQFNDMQQCALAGVPEAVFFLTTLCSTVDRSYCEEPCFWYESRKPLLADILLKSTRQVAENELAHHAWQAEQQFIKECVTQYITSRAVADLRHRS